MCKEMRKYFLKEGRPTNITIKIENKVKRNGLLEDIGQCTNDWEELG